MHLIKKLFLSILVLYLINGVYLSQFVLNVIKPAIVVRTHPEGYYDYSGVLNIQSIRSTGSGTYLDIIQDAQSSGLDFIFVNDFNDTNPDKTFERYYDHLLVFIDSEFKYLDSNVLFYGRNDYSEFTSAGQTQALLADMLSNESFQHEDNGLPVLAHPFKNGHEWAGRLPSGFHGIEVINLKSIWQTVWQENKSSFLWSVLIYPFNPELALVRMFPFPNREIQLWDELNNNKQKTFAYAGADADGKIKFPKDFKLPSYETLFNIVRTHVLLDSELTGDFNTDAKKIKKSLAKGNFYISLDKLANPVGFNAVITDSENNPHLMGSSLSFNDSQNLEINFPQQPLYPIDIMVFKDGEKVMSSNSLKTSIKIHSKGIYRVVVRIIPTLPLPDGKKWIPWIISNPFFIN